jgi:putative ABC transport system permease protein
MQPLFATANIPALYLAVRTTATPEIAIAAVRNEVAAIDPDQPIANVMTMDDRISQSVAPRRFNMFLFGLFAVLGLVLAAIGIYGIMSFSVSQRTQEIGIRMALGANRGDVLRLIMKNGFVLALIGIVTGLVASLAATRLMSTLLFDVSATDPSTFVIYAVVLGAVGLFACYVPARRATKVDPLVALRNE